MKYNFLEHTADIKIKSYGKSLNQAVENLVLAISSYLGKGKNIKSMQKKIVEIEGGDEKNLIYKLIDEIIFLLDAENFIVSKAKIKIVGDKLKVEFSGDDSTKYKSLGHIKAATYAEMEIEQTKKGWEVQAVVDV